MTANTLPIRLFLTLFAFWLILSGALVPGSLLTGLVVAAVIAWLFRDGLSYLSGYRFTPDSLVATVAYVGFFLKELVKANIAMARLVLSRDLPVDPAIVRVHTKLTDPVARLLLANSITLTPGTLTVEIEGDHLFVHWVVAGTIDPEEATQKIVAGFEHYLEKMYG